MAAGRLAGADEIGDAVGKVIDKYKMGKHFHYTITDTTWPSNATTTRSTPKPPSTASTCCAPVPDDQLDPAAVVTGYKNLANVERDFRIIKADDLDLRPIHHRLDDRVKAHVLICMLACYLVWHLRKAWAPMTFTDEHPPQRDNPVAPAQRSADADAKAATKHDPARQPAAQLRRPARPPGHPHPQPDPLHRHRHRNAHARRPHPRPTPRLRPPRRPHPTHHHVARTTTPTNQRTPSSARDRGCPESRRS